MMMFGGGVFGKPQPTQGARGGAGAVSQREGSGKESQRGGTKAHLEDVRGAQEQRINDVHALKRQPGAKGGAEDRYGAGRGEYDSGHADNRWGDQYHNSGGRDQGG